jgi:hypothetical protein
MGWHEVAVSRICKRHHFPRVKTDDGLAGLTTEQAEKPPHKNCCGRGVLSRLHSIGQCSALNVLHVHTTMQ